MIQDTSEGKKRPEVRGSPSPVLAHLILEEVWNMTPVFQQTFYKPSTSTPLQANDTLPLMLMKQRIKYRTEGVPNSGCLLLYWPSLSSLFTPELNSVPKLSTRYSTRRYGLNSTVCCPCCYQASSP